MGHSVKFTSSVGQLLPVFYDFLLTGDKVKISEEMFTRTAPLSTASFVDLREHIEYFFVPMTLIFSLYPQFKFSVGKPKSNIFDAQAVNATFPVFDAATLASCLAGGTSNQYPYLWSVNAGYMPQFEKLQYWGRHRLANMLGYSFPKDLGEEMPRDVKINPFLACAYQKIYYDFYNIDDREVIDRMCYNLDAWYSEYVSAGGGSTHAQDFAHAFSSMLCLRYVPWKKDYFMGMYVSPLETARSKNTDFFGSNLEQITDYINRFNAESVTSSPSSISATDDNMTEVGVESLTASSVNGALNAIRNRLNTGFIRKMFALEKYLSITRRSKDDYASLTAAHFGTDMNPIYSDRSMFLGSTGQQIAINDIAATVNNEDTSLGELAGKGVGYKKSDGKDTVNFTAPCDGVIMGIYYARPEIDYKSYGIDRLNKWTLPSDLYTPEYANLGLQPVFENELGLKWQDSRQSEINRIIGWQYRYSEFKSKINKVYTGFCESALSDYTIASHFEPYTFGSQSRDFYVDPSALDSIMVEQYKGGDISPSEWNYSFDPLLHWFRFNYLKVSVMDKFGLPKL